MPSSPCGKEAYSLKTLRLLRKERCDILNKRYLVRNLKRKVNAMKYPFMTLDDQTEIVHSEMHEDGTVEVYIEKPDEKDCFHSVSCYLPKYEWKITVALHKKSIKSSLLVPLGRRSGKKENKLRPLLFMRGGRSFLQSRHDVRQEFCDMITFVCFE